MAWGHVSAISRASSYRASAVESRVDDRTSLKSEITAVPVLSLRPGDSPRLNGVNKAHIARLAEIDGPLPPILVERRTMQVIDGMHRLMAASLRGEETIAVEFFDGNLADAFIQAVEANVTHGLPLTREDRQAAAARILMSHPQISDRALAKLVGLATRTVAAIRRSSPSPDTRQTIRVGRDGKARPVNGAEGRRRAAATIIDHPDASLREVARIAGVSPATARDVRKRLERGDDPVIAEPGSSEDQAARSGRATAMPSPTKTHKVSASVHSSVDVLLNKLLKDPSLRQREHGRRLLRLLQINAISEDELNDLLADMPPHCVATVEQIARQNIQMWRLIARRLDERVGIIDPKAHGRHKAAW